MRSSSSTSRCKRWSDDAAVTAGQTGQALQAGQTGQARQAGAAQGRGGPGEGRRDREEKGDEVGAARAATDACAAVRVHSCARLRTWDSSARGSSVQGRGVRGTGQRRTRRRAETHEAPGRRTTRREEAHEAPGRGARGAGQWRTARYGRHKAGDERRRRRLMLQLDSPNPSTSPPQQQARE
ncbi:unnamed protein product [Closterium sp. Naga37s-1]|nr:unnamed protein product [Closterium sp. Naga37s-1]